MADYNMELLSLPAADDPALVDQFFRTLGYTYFGVADIAEVYAIGHRLPPGDAEGQYETWRAAARHYLELGERKLAAGRKVSARRAFLRAAEYHRASHFQLREDLWDPAVLIAVEDMMRAADAGYALAADYDARRIAIPFEGKELLGLVFARNGEWSVPRPTIFAFTGYDSFVEGPISSPPSRTRSRGATTSPSSTARVRIIRYCATGCSCVRTTRRRCRPASTG